jgi:hypothetical protein
MISVVCISDSPTSWQGQSLEPNTAGQQRDLLSLLTLSLLIPLIASTQHPSV